MMRMLLGFLMLAGLVACGHANQPDLGGQQGNHLLGDPGSSPDDMPASPVPAVTDPRPGP